MRYKYVSTWPNSSAVTYVYTPDFPSEIDVAATR